MTKTSDSAPDPMQVAIEMIEGAEHILVTCHRRPDGDALGSALGMAAGLRALGKKATVYCPDVIPRSLQFLLAEQVIETELPQATEFSATLVMDAATPGLLAEPFPSRKVSGPVIVLDHHRSSEDFGDVMVRDADAPATGTVVLEILTKMGLSSIPRLAAIPLYAALCADTGGFRYASTDAKTLRSAADLLDAGADPWQAAYNLFEGWVPKQIVLLRHALESMSFEHDGKLAVIRVSRSVMEKIGAIDEMVDGLVNYGRSVRGVEIAALLWERPEVHGDPKTKISFRSQGTIDVAQLAGEFGGGGHRLAAAALVPGSIADLLPRVVELAGREIEAIADR